MLCWRETCLPSAVYRTPFLGHPAQILVTVCTDCCIADPVIIIIIIIYCNKLLNWFLKMYFNVEPCVWNQVVSSERLVTSRRLKAIHYVRRQSTVVVHVRVQQCDELRGINRCKMWKRVLQCWEFRRALAGCAGCGSTVWQYSGWLYRVWLNSLKIEWLTIQGVTE